LRMLIE